MSAFPALAEPLALSLETAVNNALRDHPALKSSAYEVTAARAGLAAAKERANPEIVIAPTLAGDQGTPEAVSISQPLELNGVRRVRTRIETAALRSALAEREVLEREVGLQVRHAYWEAALALEIAEVERKNVEHSHTLAAAAQRQVELGNHPRMHQIKADVELARARQQLIAAEAGAAQAMSALCAAMGAPPDASYALTETLAFEAVGVEPTALVEAAMRTRPELRMAESVTAQAEGEVEAARLARKPDVAVTYWQETFDSSGGLGVSVNLPLFDWGGTRERQAQARALASARREAAAQVEQQIRLEVRQAITALLSAEAQVRELQERVIEQSEQLAQITSIGYQEGALNLLDDLEAQRTLRSVLLEHQAALAEYIKARATLEWASGVRLEARTAPSPSPAAAAPAASAPPGAIVVLPASQPGLTGVVTLRRLPPTVQDVAATVRDSEYRTVTVP
ncbi:MAG: TolC family protein [Armatimonadetes bacterium]|nr:TolC family protein [Armatimonadota bacterium]